MSVLTPIDFCHAWAIFGPLVDKNTRNGELVELPASDTWGLSFIRIRSLLLKSFLDFFLNVVPYQLESWYIHWVGCTTYWVHVSLEWDPCDIMFLALAQLTNKAFTDAGKGLIRQSLTALVLSSTANGVMGAVGDMGLAASHCTFVHFCPSVSQFRFFQHLCTNSQWCYLKSGKLHS